MKKMRFFAFVAVALFAMSFASCNKEDVSYDDMNANYVVTPDNDLTAINPDGSWSCPWCGAHVFVGNYCKHSYGYGEDCGDPDCIYYGTGMKHFHVFDVCANGHATHYHMGGGTSTYTTHSH